MGIVLSDCSIQNHGSVIIKSLTWDSSTGKNWLITGASGSGKTVLVSALAGFLDVVPGEKGFYSNSFHGAIELVSFESAAALIEDEQKRDDSDFVEGGVDPGRTPRQLIMETIHAEEALLYPQGNNLEMNPAVSVSGIQSVLDRGLKYLSTGEIRRTLLCKALAAKPSLLILDDPFDGLDTAARDALCALLSEGLENTYVFLVVDRLERIPSSISHVLELTNSTISFSGMREDYEQFLGKRDKASQEVLSLNTGIPKKKQIKQQIEESRVLAENIIMGSARTECSTLIEMKNVTVEWSERKVLANINWSLKCGEHWLIRGPNGSGKTTFLELITGDNPQVFRNDIWMFGSKRGTGETIWELKEKMGIVSYRLHTEYRSLGDLSLETILLSGLHDSIGLYQQCGDEERNLANKWLKFTGFAERSTERFSNLSYGEQRAILIARAAIKQPPILILDEPCHGLDIWQRDKILSILQAIAETGNSTLLHVTHDATEVLPCEHHILELCPGRNPMYQILVI